MQLIVSYIKEKNIKTYDILLCMIHSILIGSMFSLMFGFLWGYIIPGKINIMSIDKSFTRFFGVLTDLLILYISFKYLPGINFVDNIITGAMTFVLLIISTIFIGLFLIGASIGDYFEKR